MSDLSMMEGYSASTKGTEIFSNSLINLVDPLIHTIPLPTSGPFNIADYGAADGISSLGLFSHIIRVLRERRENLKICIFYNDRPENKFSLLFQLLSSRFPEGVYYYGSGRSFYEQNFPDNYIHFAFSSTAQHWLTETPIKIKNHIHMVGANETERNIYAKKAASDWSLLMACRSREFFPGAIGVFANLTIDKNGYYLGNTGVGVSMFGKFLELWRGLVGEGIISNEEFENTNFPQHYRKYEEFVKCFEDTHEEAYQRGLRFVSSSTIITPCPYRAQYNQDKDGKKFSKNYIGTLSSWSTGAFKSGLDQSRPEKEKDDIINLFFSRYQQEVENEPTLHSMDYVHEVVIFKKELL